MEHQKENLPKHIAIIMDGNRRWSKQRGKNAIFGHNEGARALGKIVRYANKIGIEYLTVYAFSTENWKRTEKEVNNLMTLFRAFIKDNLKKADSENIRVRFLGDSTRFNAKLQKGIAECVEKTKNNTGLTFNIALNYGGRTEIIKAIKEIAQDIKNNELNIEDIDENIVASKLYTANQPDPDLLIRTSGEQRLSNFLPWQLVYTEFLFVDKYWPDFNEQDLDNAIIEYNKRTRKYGAN